jgi:cyclohexanecarboxyl-CoA dehydrogenase
MVFLTEVQKRFQREMQDFASKELAQGAKERVKLDYITSEVINKIADAGLLRMTMPAKYGGKPIDYVSIGIVFEEICRVDFSPFSMILSHTLIPQTMELASEELKEEWLPVLGKGNKLACFGNTEPDCGSDAAAITTRAIRDGDYYVIKGEKTSISGGMQADAILFTAKTDMEAGARGVTCFFVPFDLDGISKSRFVDMGIHPSGRASIFFDDVHVPARFRIGEEGEGFTRIMSGLDFARVLVAIATVAMAEASLSEAVEYSKTRTKFGNPLCDFEGVSFKLAEDLTLIESSRLLCYEALKLKDEGLPNTKEAAMAKWYAVDSSVRILHDVLKILGFRGYSDATPVEQRLRDAIGSRIGDGTAEIMKLIIAREMIGRKVRPIM